MRLPPTPGVSTTLTAGPRGFGPGELTVIGELALQVGDVGAAVRWYAQNVPQCRVLFEDAHWAVLEAGGARLAFVQREPHPRHVAFRVELAELERLAREHGQPVSLHPDGTCSAMIPVPGDGPVELLAYPAERGTA